MASIKVKFRPSSLPDIEGTIYYQIVHDRKVRHMLTGHKLFSSEWDVRRSTVVVSPESDRRHLLRTVREHIRRDLERLAGISRRLDADRMAYSVDDLIEEFRIFICEYSLVNFMEGIIRSLRLSGKTRTSETYRAALGSFMNFREGEDIMLDCLNSEIMEKYEAWLLRRGVRWNTVSFYARILRAAYNRAVEHGAIEDRRPFRHIYTGIDKTVKRALPLGVIKKIVGLDLSLFPAVDFARDMFLLSFYLRGMSLIDMAFLKKSDLCNGCVTYRRQKTGQLLTIAWTDEMQQLLDKYPENASGYLLPIIRNPVRAERSAYHNMGYNINHNLKKLAELVGLGIPLTLYVARHSWASAARAKGIPLSVISEGLGHDSETTTRIYLAELDTSKVDRANSIIMKSLK